MTPKYVLSSLGRACYAAGRYRYLCISAWVCIHSFCASDSSFARVEHLLSLQSAKYLPLTPSIC